MTVSQLSPLGRRIRELQGDLTETGLCERLHLSRNQLYNIKHGRTGTSTETISRMVQIFGLKQKKEIEELYHLAGFVPPKSVGEASEPDPDAGDWARIQAQYDLTDEDIDELSALAELKRRRRQGHTFGKKAE